MKALEVNNLKISYRCHNQIYKYPNFTIGKGECLSIMGASGCGKTTLLNGLYNLNFNGRVKYTTAKLFDADIKSYNKKIYEVVSYLPQYSQSALNPSITIKEHIYHIANGIAKDSEDYLELLQILKLDKDILSLYPHQLSGGMKQRIVLLLGSLKNPQLYVLDEPSTAIDSITLKIILSFLREKKDKGTSMMMVTHDYGFSRLISDEILILGT
ncbi:ATP-binding cassette domain-containing protein [Alkaliphilus peptidifermentans]|uniref:Peptide/nickel transport system ATP-binding protein n=1 Tax=Alkaliphilus peptidifermentans DSM 18978 TaxID=1120976 RepID=A0A1G5JM56_9FIRM|nr:ATP-binding cassette domain-containing protein [Alkaliphilus peptidifermentans]SCY89001.1 peptide/nickel transport system ATP-binding protein [Alkaliphilus peptidifermentans DSM 18978]